MSSIERYTETELRQMNQSQLISIARQYDIKIDSQMSVDDIIRVLRTGGFIQVIPRDLLVRSLIFEYGSNIPGILNVLGLTVSQLEDILRDIYPYINLRVELLNILRNKMYEDIYNSLPSKYSDQNHLIVTPEIQSKLSNEALYGFKVEYLVCPIYDPDSVLVFTGRDILSSPIIEIERIIGDRAYVYSDFVNMVCPIDYISTKIIEGDMDSISAYHCNRRVMYGVDPHQDIDSLISMVISYDPNFTIERMLSDLITDYNRHKLDDIEIDIAYGITYHSITVHREKNYPHDIVLQLHGKNLVVKNVTRDIILPIEDNTNVIMVREGAKPLYEYIYTYPSVSRAQKAFKNLVFHNWRQSMSYYESSDSYDDYDYDNFPLYYSPFCSIHIE